MKRLVWFVVLALLASAGACQKVDRSAPASPAVPAPKIVVTDGGVEMVLIPAGRFVMGTDDGPPEQGPAHEVELDAFLMDRCEVTQAVYAKMEPVNGSHFKGPDLPTEMIGWGKAALYCNMRSEAEGLKPCYNEFGECDFEADGYRLPTEAEWEYACRAGSDTPYNFGSDSGQLGQHAWYAQNANKKTHPAGGKSPNAWGLYDMHGNVAEWCNDFYAPDYYAGSPATNPRGPAEGEKNVLRGGHWGASAESCTSTFRIGEDPGFSDACFARDAIGFRCVRRFRAETPAGGAPQPPASEKGASAMPLSRFAIPMTVVGAQPEPVERTGLVYDEIYLRHLTGSGHPECPERLEAIVDRLRASGLMDKLTGIKPRPAEEKWLTAIHTPEHVAALRRMYAEGSRFAGSRDTPLSESSSEVALVAAGGVLAAVDAVVKGQVRNAFCAVRPPGHHATPDKAMGFCLLNNVAVAARYLQKEHRLPRILIVDWDVHHGNGTQEIFYEDPSVFYFSVHQYPFYPGTGSAGEQGAGEGKGSTLNVPLPAGSGDAEFRQAFSDKLVPAARQFHPDFVLVSAGFDAHQDDLLGRMKVTTEGFAELTRIVRQIAEEHCGGRLVSVLEGGYHLEKLAASVEAHLRVLME